MKETKIEGKLNLLMRAWLSDKNGLSDRAVEEEARIIKEMKEDLE